VPSTAAKAASSASARVVFFLIGGERRSGCNRSLSLIRQWRPAERALHIARTQRRAISSNGAEPLLIRKPTASSAAAEMPSRRSSPLRSDISPPLSRKRKRTLCQQRRETHTPTRAVAACPTWNVFGRRTGVPKGVPSTILVRAPVAGRDQVAVSALQALSSVPPRRGSTQMEIEASAPCVSVGSRGCKWPGGVNPNWA
jgi:hypothetical protein